MTHGNPELRSLAAKQPGAYAPCANVHLVPNQPATPNHAVRVSDELWNAAKRVAKDRDETVTDVIRRALERYVASHPLPPEE